MFPNIKKPKHSDEQPSAGFSTICGNYEFFDPTRTTPQRFSHHQGERSAERPTTASSASSATADRQGSSSPSTARRKAARSRSRSRSRNRSRSQIHSRSRSGRSGNRRPATSGSRPGASRASRSRRAEDRTMHSGMLPVAWAEMPSTASGSLLRDLVAATILAPATAGDLAPVAPMTMPGARAEEWPLSPTSRSPSYSVHANRILLTTPKLRSARPQISRPRPATAAAAAASSARRRFDPDFDSVARAAASLVVADAQLRLRSAAAASGSTRPSSSRGREARTIEESTRHGAAAVAQRAWRERKAWRDNPHNSTTHDVDTSLPSLASPKLRPTKPKYTRDGALRVFAEKFSKIGAHAAMRRWDAISQIAARKAREKEYTARTAAATMLQRLYRNKKARTKGARMRAAWRESIRLGLRQATVDMLRRRLRMPDVRKKAAGLSFTRPSSARPGKKSGGGGGGGGRAALLDSLTPQSARTPEILAAAEKVRRENRAAEDAALSVAVVARAKAAMDVIEQYAAIEKNDVLRLLRLLGRSEAAVARFAAEPDEARFATSRSAVVKAVTASSDGKGRVELTLEEDVFALDIRDAAMAHYGRSASFTRMMQKGYRMRLRRKRLMEKVRARCAITIREAWRGHQCRLLGHRHRAAGRIQLTFWKYRKRTQWARWRRRRKEANQVTWNQWWATIRVRKRQRQMRVKAYGYYMRRVLKEMQKGAALDAVEWKEMQRCAKQLQRAYRHHVNAAYMRVLHRIKATTIQRKMRRHRAKLTRAAVVLLRDRAARRWQGFIRATWVARGMLELAHTLKHDYLGSLERKTAQVKVGKLHSQFHRDKLERLTAEFEHDQMACITLAYRIFRISRRVAHGDWVEGRGRIAAMRQQVLDDDARARRAMVKVAMLTGMASQIRIKKQPQSMQVVTGAPAFFEAMAVCVKPRGLKFIWERRGEVLKGKRKNVTGGAITSVFSIDAVCEADEGTYVCTVVDPTGQMARTTQATLKVLSRPFISAHPQSLTVAIYGHAKLGVRAVSDGNLPLSFSWLKDGVHMEGTASESALELANFGPADVGIYCCEVKSDAGVVRSRDAYLILSPHA